MARGVRLTDGIVELAPPRRTDTGSLHSAICRSLPELLPWMAWAHPEYREVEAAEWVRRAGRAFADGLEFQFVARSVESGEIVGCVGLNAIDRLNRWANLGYWIRTDVTGHGYATRAARLVSAFGLSEVGLGRIEILAAVENLPSQRVAERAGGLREGLLRRRLRVGDDVQDAVVFSLIS
jgi:Acetyltransferases, including N-acetylases of ribosomal proteins